MNLKKSSVAPASRSGATKKVLNDALPFSSGS